MISPIQQTVLVAVAVLLACASGCHRIAPYQSAPGVAGVADAQPADAGVDGAADAGADAGVDGSADVGANASPPCPPPVDPDTVALFAFAGSGSALGDTVTGIARGKLVDHVVHDRQGCVTSLRFTPPPTSQCQSCASTLIIDRCTTSAGFATLESTALAVGSVDFWFRLDRTSGAAEGLISRDINGLGAGHLDVRVVDGKTIVMRLQSASTLATICSTPVDAVSRWVHVAINFGGSPPELFVDGALMNGANTARFVPTGSYSALCDVGPNNVRTGIDGNDEPWLLGASATASCKSATAPQRDPLRGWIANVRISRVRRAFARP